MEELALVDKSLFKPEDMEFLEAHKGQFQERFRTRSLFRSRFEMETMVLNDEDHPTPDSKYWQAIGEQAVHVDELINLSFRVKLNTADLAILQSELDELEWELGMLKSQESIRPFVTNRIQAKIDKKKVEIEEKEHQTVHAKKVAKERLKEIRNWEEIIAELEPKLVHGVEDWEKHHPERYFKRFSARLKRLPALDPETKANTIKYFESSANHSENRELKGDWLKQNQKPEQLGAKATVPVKPTGEEVKSQVLQAPKDSKQVDYPSKEELVQSDPIAQRYFSRKVRSIVVATPHRTPNDFNVTDFNQMQPPAGVNASLEQPWGFSVPDARNFIVEKAIKDGIEYVFFVDDDVVIPRNALVQLFKHQADVVGGMYYRKYLPLETVPMVEIEDGVPGSLDNYEIGDVIHNTLVLPSGCTLIKTEVLAKMDPPWYKTMTVQGKSSITEDTYICERFREQGVDILLDTGVQCLHLDVARRKIFGHSDIVDFESQEIREGYHEYFATQVFQKA